MLELVKALVILMEGNAKTWVVEAAIRQECPKDLAAGGPPPDLREIGRRALEIRSYNKIRCEAKAKIDEIFGDIPDRKIDHASQ